MEFQANNSVLKLLPTAIQRHAKDFGLDTPRPNHNEPQRDPSATCTFGPRANSVAETSAEKFKFNPNFKYDPDGVKKYVDNGKLSKEEAKELTDTQITNLNNIWVQGQIDHHKFDIKVFLYDSPHNPTEKKYGTAVQQYYLDHQLTTEQAVKFDLSQVEFMDIPWTQNAITRELLTFHQIQHMEYLSGIESLSTPAIQQLIDGEYLTVDRAKTLQNEEINNLVDAVNSGFIKFVRSGPVRITIEEFINYEDRGTHTFGPGVMKYLEQKGMLTKEQFLNLDALGNSKLENEVIQNLIDSKWMTITQTLALTYDQFVELKGSTGLQKYAGNNKLTYAKFIDTCNKKSDFAWTGNFDIPLVQEKLDNGTMTIDEAINYRGA